MSRLENLIDEFSIQNLILFLRKALEGNNFKPSNEELDHLFPEDIYDKYESIIKIGEAEVDKDELIVIASKTNEPLTERTGKKNQYEIAKTILKHEVKDASLFVFYDDEGNFRFSFVKANYLGTKRDFTDFKRYTYFVTPSQTNKTFIKQVGGCNFNSLDEIIQAFSVEPLNKQFYQDIAKSFYGLIGGKVKIGSRNVEFDTALKLPSTPVETNRKIYQEFAVRLIGRTIFCWFLKSKKSENSISLVPESWLSSKTVVETNNEQHNYYHSVLEKLFFLVLNKKQADRKDYELPNDQELIPFLNGGLFEAQADDFFPTNSKGIHQIAFDLNIPNQWFIELFEVLEQYNFTIDENSIYDAEVSIDPEMLGTIFENLLAEIDPDTEKSARKATGSFYTPREIVDYMVEQSLVQYLKTKVSTENEEQLLELFKEGGENKFNPTETKNILEALSDVKILDPACGSGAFPMGALHKIINALHKLDTDASWWKQKQIENVPNALAKQMLKEKLDGESADYIRKLGVIQNSIYGVDIQPIAAEISKLRSFLSLVIDETIIDEAENRGIQALPNLEFKFVTANTLIGLEEKKQAQGAFDFGQTDELQDQLKTIRNQYLQAYGEEKIKLKKDFDSVQTKILKQEIAGGGQNKRALQLASWKPFSNESNAWFDPYWMYGVDKFDIVIGNPPYVQVREVSELLQKEYRNCQYYKYARGGRLNLYQFFFPLSLSLSKDLGIICLITQNSVLAEDTAINIRMYLFDNSIPIEFTSFPERDNKKKRVFEGVKMSVAISMLQKSSELQSKQFLVKTYAEKHMLNMFSISTNKTEIEEVYPQKLIIPMAEENSWELLKKFRLEENKVKFKAYAGEIDMSKYNELFNESGQGLRVFTGAQILRYTITNNPSQGSLIYLEKKHIPVTNKSQARNHKRIAMQRITGVDSKTRLIMTIIPPDTLCANSTNFIIMEEDNLEEFVLGVLNSKFINYIFKITSTNTNITTSEINEIPIPNYNLEIEKLVNEILTLREKGYETKELENRIDIIVYNLYKLTYQEVKIIDPEFTLTQEEYENYKIE